MVYPSSSSGRARSAASEAYKPPLFSGSAFFDKLMDWYPEEAIGELWERLPDDAARKRSFPRLFGELWREARKRKRTVVFITRLLKGET